MAESDENFSSSSSEDETEYSEGSDSDVGTITDSIAPYQNEPLATIEDSLDGLDENDEADEDGLIPATLEQRFEKTIPVGNWCSCNHCNDAALESAREFRCCKEVDCAIAKLVFDGTIEQFTCITQHPDFIALTNRAVLTQVAPLLKGKDGRTYRRRGNTSENEFLRATAYRWLIRWIFGYLGWDNCRPLPACIYHNVRSRFTSHHTTGYTSAEDRS